MDDIGDAAVAGRSRFRGPVGDSTPGHRARWPGDAACQRFPGTAGLRHGRRLRLRESADRHRAGGPRYLVLLDRRQREVLGADGGAHRGQRRPAQLRGLPPARAPLPRAGGRDAAGLRAGHRARRVRAVARHLPARRAARVLRATRRHRRPAAVPEPGLQSRELECGNIPDASEGHAAALPDRHGLRLLPRRLQSAQSAGRSRAAEVERTGRRHRQPVLGGRPALQPEDDAEGFPLAPRQPAAAGHLGHVTIRDRSRAQPEQHQRRVPAGPSSDRDGEDARWHGASRASHPQGRRRLGGCGRGLAARVREHRHVLGHLADAHRPGGRTRAAAAVPHGRGASEVRRLAQHGSAHGGRRGLPEDHRPDAPRRCARGRPLPRRAAGRGEPGRGRLRTRVRAVPLEQAAAIAPGRSRGTSRLVRERRP